MKGSKSDQSFVPPLWILTLFSIGLLLWLLIELKEIVVLLVVGYSIAYVIDPMLSWMEQRKISRSVGFFAVLGVFVIVLLIAATTAIPTIVEEGTRLIDNFPSYFNTAKQEFRVRYDLLLTHLPPNKRKLIMASPDDILPAIGPDALKGFLTGVVTALLSGYSITLTILNMTLLPFIVFYLAVGFPQLHSRALSLFPRAYQKTVTKLGGQIDSHVSAFIRGQLMVGAVLFLLYCLGLGLIGVELWFLLAFISGFGNLVPYLGSIVGLVSASVMALVTFGDFTHLFYVWGVFAGVQAIEGTVLTPRIVGEKVGLSPLTVILAIFAAGKLLGLLGLFLAIPLAAVIRVTGSYAHGLFIKRSEA